MILQEKTVRISLCILHKESRRFNEKTCFKR